MIVGNIPRLMLAALYETADELKWSL